ncbi:MAG TPA: CvpA family protein [Gammaproteobacteria bacterium]|nr:CvpA family protein [Gammaproteobacteria bacterium]
MDNMNWVDYIFIIIFAVSILVGFKRGIIKEIISIAAIVAAIVIASLFSDRLAAAFMNAQPVKNFITWASNFIGMDTTSSVSYFALLMSFCILFAATMIVGSIITNVLSLGLDVGILSLGNHVLGAVFGLVRGLIIVLIVIFLVQLTPLGRQSWWQQSVLVTEYQPYVARFIAFVSPAIAAIEEKTKVGETLKETGQKIQQLIQ